MWMVCVCVSGGGFTFAHTHTHTHTNTHTHTHTNTNTHTHKHTQARRQGRWRRLRWISGTLQRKVRCSCSATPTWQKTKKAKGSSTVVAYRVSQICEGTDLWVLIFNFRRWPARKRWITSNSSVLPLPRITWSWTSTCQTLPARATPSSLTSCTCFFLKNINTFSKQKV